MTAPRVAVHVTGEDEGVTQLLRALSRQLKSLEGDQRSVAAGSAQLTRAHRTLSGTVQSLTNNLRRLALGYGAIQAARFLKSSIDTADAIGKLAIKTGASTEALSVLAFAARTADVSTEGLGNGLKFLAKSLVDLEKGGTASVAAFRAIGLSAADLEGLSVDQAFVKIAEALGGFEDGTGKTAVALQLFGRAGSDLLPLLDDIADQGFGNLEASARRLGVVFTRDMTDKAEQFNDQLTTLGTVSRGVAAEFAAGILPALVDVGNQLVATGEAGDESLAKKLGASAGEFIRNTILGFRVLKIEATGTFAQIGETGRLTFTGLKQAARGELTAAVETFRQIPAAMQAINDDTALQLQELAGQMAATPTPSAAGRTPSGGQSTRTLRRLLFGEQQVADDAARARLDAARQAREAEQRLAEEQAKNAEATARASYDAGLTALGDYYAERERLTRDAAARERAALLAAVDEAKARPVTSAADAIRRDGEARAAALAVEQQAVRTAGDLAALERERAADAQRLADAIAAAEAKIAEARGDTAAATEGALAREVEAYRTALRQKGGITEDELTARVEQFRGTLADLARLADLQQRAQREFDALGNVRTRIQQDQVAGLLTEQQAQAQIADVEASRVPVLREIVAQMQTLAHQLSPEAVQQVDALAVQLDGLGRAADRGTLLALQFGENSADAVEGALSGTLSSLGTEINSVGDAFQSLAQSAVQAIQRIVAEILAAQVVQGLSGLLGLGGGLPSIPNVSIPNVEIPGIGFASGGYIRGPGTATSDSIAARLSAGEYVVRAAAVQRYGVDLFHALNGLKTPTFRSPAPVRGVQRFAAGGLVAPGAGGGASEFGGRLDVSLAEGLIAREVRAYLKSRGGEEQVVGIAINNRRTLRGALG